MWYIHLLHYVSNCSSVEKEIAFRSFLYKKNFIQAWSLNPCLEQIVIKKSVSKSLFGIAIRSTFKDLKIQIFQSNAPARKIQSDTIYYAQLHEHLFLYETTRAIFSSDWMWLIVIWWTLRR